MPQDIPVACDGCNKKILIEHALSCPKGDLVLARHDAAAKKWCALGSQALAPSAITYKPKINNRTVQGERTGALARKEGREANGGTETVGEAQGVKIRMVNGADRLIRQPVQVVVPLESRADVSNHGFWKKENTKMFDIRIVNLDMGSLPAHDAIKVSCKGGGLLPSGLPGA